MQMDRVPFALAAASLALAISTQAQSTTGEAIYKQRCAACHDQSGSRIPPRASLEKLPAVRILRAMNSGAMMTVAYPFVATNARLSPLISVPQAQSPVPNQTPFAPNAPSS
jgi:hypothetical protein